MVVLPAIASFAAAGGTVAGVAAALTGAAGFATFATVAGGFLASAGMLTGSKTLTKLGGILSLTGGLTSLASSMGSSAGSAAGEAASNAASDAASSAWDSAGSAAGSDAAQFAKYAKNPIAGSGLEAAATETSALTSASLDGAGAALAGGDQSYNLMEQARLMRSAPSDLAGTLQSQNQALVTSAQDAALSQPFSGAPSNVPRSVLEGANQLQGADHMNQLLDKVKGGASSVGKFIKDNKELVNLTGNALQAMNDPRSQYLDWQKSLMERRRQNLNSPIRMTVGGGT